jgi:hypothetical protein
MAEKTKILRLWLGKRHQKQWLVPIIAAFIVIAGLIGYGKKK